jgi:hypothetical protein
MLESELNKLCEALDRHTTAINSAAEAISAISRAFYNKADDIQAASHKSPKKQDSADNRELKKPESSNESDKTVVTITMIQDLVADKVKSGVPREYFKKILSSFKISQISEACDDDLVKLYDKFSSVEPSTSLVEVVDQDSDINTFDDDDDDDSIVHVNSDNNANNGLDSNSIFERLLEMV